ncbi:MAG: hypothetical protein IPJ78_19480 [Gemmatimonadetes bacterium]|nr:hypothetical protein [Gemmatimonadota bacterium]
MSISIHVALQAELRRIGDTSSLTAMGSSGRLGKAPTAAQILVRLQELPAGADAAALVAAVYEPSDTEVSDVSAALRRTFERCELSVEERVLVEVDRIAPRLPEGVGVSFPSGPRLAATLEMLRTLPSGAGAEVLGAALAADSDPPAPNDGW